MNKSLVKRQETIVDPTGQLSQWMGVPRRVLQEPGQGPVLFSIFGAEMSTDAIQNRKDKGQL